MLGIANPLTIRSYLAVGLFAAVAGEETAGSIQPSATESGVATASALRLIQGDAPPQGGEKLES